MTWGSSQGNQRLCLTGFQMNLINIRLTLLGRFGIDPGVIWDLKTQGPRYMIKGARGFRIHHRCGGQPL